jgi:hypothetical protein
MTVSLSSRLKICALSNEGYKWDSKFPTPLAIGNHGTNISTVVCDCTITPTAHPYNNSHMCPLATTPPVALLSIDTPTRGDTSNDSLDISGQLFVY